MGLDIGGAETHVVELALELKRRGADVSVASNGGVYEADLAKAGIPHYKAPMDRRSLRCMAKSYFIMRKLIRHEKPDIVHAHARIPGFICGLLHRKKRFKFVATAHWVFDVSGSLRRLTNWGQKTIAVSDDIKQYLIENYGIPQEDISVTINGVDTEKFSPDIAPDGIISEFRLDPNRPIICNVSRLDESAAAATRVLIDIAPQLHERIPGVQLVIAGGGDIFSELKEKADAVNAHTGSNTVTMTDARTDINCILSACDLFVGVSRAAIEAMASRKPVIMAGKEGYVGLFTPDKVQIAMDTNYCFRGCELTSHEPLLCDITEFFADTDYAKRAVLGEFGRELVIKEYSVKKMTDDCMKVYNAVSR